MHFSEFKNYVRKTFVDPVSPVRSRRTRWTWKSTLQSKGGRSARSCRPLVLTVLKHTPDLEADTDAVCPFPPAPFQWIDAPVKMPGAGSLRSCLLLFASILRPCAAAEVSVWTVDINSVSVPDVRAATPSPSSLIWLQASRPPSLTS